MTRILDFGEQSNWYLSPQNANLKLELRKIYKRSWIVGTMNHPSLEMKGFASLVHTWSVEFFSFFSCHKVL